MRVLTIFAFFFAIALAGRIPTKANNNSIDIDLSELDENLRNLKVEVPPELLSQLKEIVERDPEEIPGLLRDSAIIAEVNEFVDKLFENIRLLIVQLNLDPLPLPDTTLEVILGKLALTNGVLTELATMGRGGDVYLEYSSNTKKVKLNVPIKFDNLIFNYNYKTTVVIVSIKGGVEGVVENVSAKVAIGFDFVSYHASLEENINIKIGKIRLNFSGHDLIDWITEVFADVVTIFFRGLIEFIVERIIRSPTEQVIDLFNEIIDRIFHATTTAPPLVANVY